MGTINDLSVSTSVNSADKLPLWSAANGVTRALPVSVLDDRYLTKDEIALLPISPNPEIFMAGDGIAPNTFVPGVSLALTLKNLYYSAANVEVFFDGTFQGPDQYSLIGYGLSFNSPIPEGTQKVYIRGGAARLIGAPSDGSVQDSSIASGSSLALLIQNRVVDSIAALRQVPVKATRVFVTGYYAMGDGGGGGYHYSASTSSSLDNGGSIIAASGGIGCWILSCANGVSIRQFGAVGDGVTDDTPAIQQALNAAYDVFVPVGTYLVSSLNVPAHVKFHGMNPINSGFFQDLTHGAWLYCVGLVNPALSLGSASTVEQLSFFYPNQVTDLVGADIPVAYPPTLKLTEGSADTMVRNCMFMNPYILLDASTPTSSHSSLWMSDIYGYPLYRGIILDNGIDVDRLDRCMFSLKYYPQSGAGLQTWVNNNAWAFYIKRADTGRATNCFAYGYYYGAVNEGTNVFTWLNCAFDCVQYDAFIDGTAFGIAYIGCGFVARTIAAPTVATDAITVNAPSVDFTVQGCRFWGVSGHAIHVLACTSGTISGNTFAGFGDLATAPNLKGAMFLEGGSSNDIDFTGNMVNCADSLYSVGVYCYQNAGGLLATGNTIKNAATAPAVFTLGSSNFNFSNNNLKHSAGVNDLSGAVNKITAPNLAI
ncbi:parallel beta-helix repeat-containing protein [Caballeronia sordidicola]|uniref:Parallel beta-helix repeat-containing protein n=1 Tax=Caballeronia sordidicola TaxID=196367 RepID=A0A158EZ14_CABSO|nr:glycosyl hydrolase family 28-related protein [Caballeronia sordidicola]SAL12010.1 parallel beta-helix repeat-containing protein [Caballeronia sordidicola]